MSLRDLRDNSFYIDNLSFVSKSRHGKRERRLRSFPLISETKKEHVSRIHTREIKNGTNIHLERTTHTPKEDDTSPSSGRVRRRWNSLGASVRRTSKSSSDSADSPTPKSKPVGWESAFDKLTMAGILNQSLHSISVRKMSRMSKLRDLHQKVCCV